MSIKNASLPDDEVAELVEMFDGRLTSETGAIGGGRTRTLHRMSLRVAAELIERMSGK
jgi:hypothetical protein